MTRWDEFVHCEECGAVLVKSISTGNIFCKLCGWSPPEENKGDDKLSYIG